MMFPIYEVKPKDDKWVLNEVYAYSTKEHSDGYDTEAAAIEVKEQLERELEQHMEALRSGPSADGREGRAVETSTKFGSEESEKAIEEGS